MNDIVVIILTLIVGFSALIFSVYSRTKPVLEKKYYIKNSENGLFVDAPSIDGALIAGAGKLLRYGKSVQIRPNTYWMELYLTVPDGGQGGSAKLFDVIFIKGSNFLFYRSLHGDAFGFLNTVVEFENTIIPKNISDALKRFGVGIDSGNWGLLIIKNSGYFKSNEVNEIIDVFVNKTNYIFKRRLKN